MIGVIAHMIPEYLLIRLDCGSQPSLSQNESVRKIVIFYEGTLLSILYLIRMSVGKLRFFD